jgi:hypothetical protein
VEETLTWLLDRKAFLSEWSELAMDKIIIEQDKMRALDTVKEMIENGENVVFTDASAKDSKLGAAVVRADMVPIRDI